MNPGRDRLLLAEFASIPPTSDYPPYNDTVKWQLMRGLLESASRYAAIMITDLFSMTDRFNVPGVVSDANWRTRFPYSTQQMREKAELNAEAVRFRDLAKETRRA